QLVVAGSIVQPACTLAVAFAPNVWTAAPAMFIAGTAWIIVANSVTIAAQLALPNWVRARGMAIYQMAIMGSAALGAVIWGRIAEGSNVPTSLACASGSALVFLVLTRGRPLDWVSDDDYTPSRPQEPVTQRPVEMAEGPVMVTIEYHVDPARLAEFEEVMAESR